MQPRLLYVILPVDGTPSSLWDYDGWWRIPGNRGLAEPRYILAHTVRKLVPDAKIVVILRNPVDRSAESRPISCPSTNV